MAKTGNNLKSIFRFILLHVSKVELVDHLGSPFLRFFIDDGVEYFDAVILLECIHWMTQISGLVILDKLALAGHVKLRIGH